MKKTILLSICCFLAGLFSITGYLKECGNMRYMSSQENMYCMGKCDDSNDLWVVDPAEAIYDGDTVTVSANAYSDSSDPNLSGSFSLDPNSGLWTNSTSDTLDEDWLAEYIASANEFNFLGAGDPNAIWDYDIDGYEDDFNVIDGSHRIYQSGSWTIDIEHLDFDKKDCHGSGSTGWDSDFVFTLRFRF